MTEQNRVRAKKPKYLYKYCSFERALQILRDKYLYLCPPEQLNDLYEFSIIPHVTYNFERAKFLEYVRVFAASDDHAIATRIVDNTSEKEIKDNYEYFIQELKNFNNNMRAHSGLISFSETFMDQRMWATYGCNHEGVCIQFSNACNESNVNDHVLPVRYSNEPEQENLPDILEKNGSLNIGNLAQYLCLRKTLDWKEEKEWRILMLASTPQKKESRYFHFKDSCVRRIFLGPRMKEDQIRLLNSTISASANDWGVFEIIPDHLSASLSFRGVEKVRCIEDVEFWSGKKLLT